MQKLHQWHKNTGQASVKEKSSSDEDGGEIFEQQERVVFTPYNEGDTVIRRSERGKQELLEEMRRQIAEDELEAAERIQGARPPPHSPILSPRRSRRSANILIDTSQETAPSSPEKRDPIIPPGLSPKQRNEALARQSLDEADALCFSRKRREVDYTPKTLKDYKQLQRRTRGSKSSKTGSYEMMGKLEPDLNTPELVEKRAKKKRLEAFSKNLRRFNREKEAQKRRRARANGRTSLAQEKEPTPAKTKRDRAKEYDASRPRPKPRPKPKPRCKAVSPSRGVRQPTRREVLEQKHDELKASVEEIRKMFGGR
jgi:hypothetical protein